MSDALTPILASSMAHGADRLVVTAPVEPNWRDVDAFAAEMGRSSHAQAATLEQQGIEQMQQMSVAINETMLNALQPEASMSPEQTLDVLKLMHNKTHDVDLIAKVAGSVSQSINKLLTMQ